MAEYAERDTRPRRTRSPFWAGVLSLMVPGLGQLYAGQPRRAATLFAALLVTDGLFLLCWYGWLPRLWVLALTLLFGAGMYLFAIVDAALAARRALNLAPTRYDRWYVAVAILAADILISRALDAAIAAASTGPGLYKVPSASMEPTIQVGEMLLADTRYYRGHKAARGDVVAYRKPDDPDTIGIFRVIGLGGDQVEVKDGRAVVNGTANEEPYIASGAPSGPIDNTPPANVPDGSVYLLGDNRGNSADSRVHGPVPIGNLVGRTTEIILSDDLHRIGTWVGTPVR